MCTPFKREKVLFRGRKKPSAEKAIRVLRFLSRIGELIF
jgi:hypothetical protein